MFHHFIFAEPKPKRKRSDSDAELWTLCGDQLERMNFIENHVVGWLLTEEQWFSYYNDREQNPEAFYELLHGLEHEHDIEQLRPYLPTLFYDAVTFNSEAFQRTVDLCQQNVDFLSLSVDFSNDRVVLLNALTPNGERESYSLDAIRFAAVAIQNDDNFMLDNVLSRNGQYITLMTLLTPELVIVALQKGDYDRDLIKDHIMGVLLQDTGAAEEALEWYGDLMEDGRFRAAWQNNAQVMHYAICYDNPENFHYVSDDLKVNRDFLLSLLEIKPNVFRFIPDNIKSKIKFVTKAMNKNVNVYRFLNDEHKRVFLKQAVGADWANFEFAGAQDIEVVRDLLCNIQNCGQLIQWTPFVNSQEMLVLAIENDWRAIRFMSPTLRINPEFVYHALQPIAVVNYVTVWGWLSPFAFVLATIPPGILVLLNNSNNVREFIRQMEHYFVEEVWNNHQDLPHDMLGIFKQYFHH